MANYYTQYSFEVADVMPEEEVWLKEQLEESYTFFHFSDEGDGTRSLWLHDDTGGSDLEVLASVLQQFLVKFRPEQSIGFSWANTCSRPLLDSFGGGAVFITVYTIDWMNTWDWLSKCKIV